MPIHTRILLAVRAYAGCASGRSCLLAGVGIFSVIGGENAAEHTPMISHDVSRKLSLLEEGSLLLSVLGGILHRHMIFCGQKRGQHLSL